MLRSHTFSEKQRQSLVLREATIRYATDKEFIKRNQIRNPLHFLCPITHTLITDPVIMDNRTYDRESLNAWFSAHKGRPIPSPVNTKVTLSIDTIESCVVDVAMKKELEIFREVVKLQESGKFIPSGSVLAPEIFLDLDKAIEMPEIKSLNLNPVQIVVIGMDKQGKSTLLERLIGFAVFPKHIDRCTICTIRVYVRRGPVKLVEIAVFDSLSGHEVEGTKTYASLHTVHEVMRQKMEYVKTNLRQGEVFSMDREITVHIQMPYAPNLNIVDLPGIVATNTGMEGEQDSAEATMTLAKSIIQTQKEHSIFLLVVRSNERPGNHLSTQLIQSEGINDRTLPVFTMLDHISESQWKNTKFVNSTVTMLTKNENVCPNWYACSNDGQFGETNEEDGYEDVSSPPPLTSVAISEEELRIDPEVNPFLVYLANAERLEDNLLSNPKLIPLMSTNQVGMKAVRMQAVRMFEDRIANKWVPVVVEKMKPAFHSLSDANANLGLPIPISDGKDVIDLTTELANKLKTEILGYFPNYDLSIFECASEDDLFHLIYKRIRKLLNDSKTIIDLNRLGVVEKLKEVKEELRSIIPKLNATESLVNRTLASFHYDLVSDAFALQSVQTCCRKYIDALRMISTDKSFWKHFFQELEQPPALFDHSVTFTEVKDIDALQVKRFPSVIDQLSIALTASMESRFAEFEEIAIKAIQKLTSDYASAFAPRFDSVLSRPSTDFECELFLSEAVLTLPDKLTRIWCSTVVGWIADRIASWTAAKGSLEAENVHEARVTVLKSMVSLMEARKALLNLKQQVNDSRKFNASGGAITDK